MTRVEIARLNDDAAVSEAVRKALTLVADLELTDDLKVPVFQEAVRLYAAVVPIVATPGVQLGPAFADFARSIK